MGVNVDPLVLGLLEDFFQIFQVVARNEDRLSLFNSQRNRGRDRVSIIAGVGGVEQLHRLQVDFAAFHGQTDAVVHCKIGPDRGRHRFLDKGVNLFRFLSEDGRMIRIGGHALDTVNQKFPQGEDVRVDVRGRPDADGFAPGHQVRRRAFRPKRGRPLGEVDMAAGGPDGLGERVSSTDRLTDQIDKSVRVEIDIGQRGKNRLADKAVGLDIDHAVFAPFNGDKRQSLNRIPQQILKGSDIGLFAADADFGTPFALGRLLALITEHILPPWIYGWTCQTFQLPSM